MNENLKNELLIHNCSLLHIKNFPPVMMMTMIHQWKYNIINQSCLYNIPSAHTPPCYIVAFLHNFASFKNFSNKGEFSFCNIPKYKIANMNRNWVLQKVVDCQWSHDHPIGVSHVSLPDLRQLWWIPSMKIRSLCHFHN